MELTTVEQKDAHVGLFRLERTSIQAAGKKPQAYSSGFDPAKLK